MLGCWLQWEHGGNRLIDQAFAYSYTFLLLNLYRYQAINFGLVLQQSLRDVSPPISYEGMQIEILQMRRAVCIKKETHFLKINPYVQHDFISPLAIQPPAIRALISVSTQKAQKCVWLEEPRKHFVSLMLLLSFTQPHKEKSASVFSPDVTGSQLLFLLLPVRKYDQAFLPGKWCKGWAILQASPVSEALRISCLLWKKTNIFFSEGNV